MKDYASGCAVTAATDAWSSSKGARKKLVSGWIMVEHANMAAMGVVADKWMRLSGVQYILAVSQLEYVPKNSFKGWRSADFVLSFWGAKWS